MTDIALAATRQTNASERECSWISTYCSITSKVYSYCLFSMSPTIASSVLHLVKSGFSVLLSIASLDPGIVLNSI
jgi:hypothetical protein